MNLGDPELELVDPTPNVHLLFLHFDKLFFWAKLASRAVVRWSKRMYSCAGICSYDSGGLCDIALSEPLLKLRPRKDLVETLLHEMIHAYLFITCRDRDRDGHGPNFKAHMHRINQAAGINISIYHDFHEEVQLYQTHWWRCNGPCQKKKPHFGIVRRSMNRAPGPSDYWWDSHKRHCGGTFVKIKEPENKQKKGASPKPTGDITKYITKNNKDKENEKNFKPILKENNNVPFKSNSITKSNSSNTIVVSKKNNIVFNPQVAKPPVAFSGKGQTISGRSRTSSAGVVETVRNVWANKQLSTTFSDTNNPKKEVRKINGSNSTNLKNLNKKDFPKTNDANLTNSNKHKAEENITSPPTKIKKIDDYFKTTATSVLKDLYGQDFVIKEVNKNKRLSVVPVQSDLVDCPVCSNKISSLVINRHLDECLNKDVIESICKDTGDTNPVINIKTDPDKVNNSSPNNIYKKDINDITKYIKTENVQLPNIKTETVNTIDLTSNEAFSNTFIKKFEANTNKTDINANVLDKNEPRIRKSDGFIVPKVEKDDKKFNSSHISSDINLPKIKIEPGSSKDTKINEQKCPCCDKVVNKSVDEHLDECLAFFDNNTTIPTEGASTSFANETIVINDDNDIFDETLTLNATGTKSPCPCCLKMIELAEMNDHLDICLS